MGPDYKVLQRDSRGCRRYCVTEPRGPLGEVHVVILLRAAVHYSMPVRRVHQMMTICSPVLMVVQ